MRQGPPQLSRIEVVDEIMVPILRAKSPGQRVEMIWSMFRFARQLASAGIRSAHPEWTDAQVKAEWHRRLGHGRA